MKLKDARELYYFYSGKTSDLVRQLALAGIAVIWIFKFEVGGTPKLPAELATPLALIIAGLAIDFAQYAIATSIWGIFQRRKELANTKEETEFLAPRQFNWPGIVCFIGKVVLRGIGVCPHLSLRLCTHLVAASPTPPSSGRRAQPRHTKGSALRLGVFAHSFAGAVAGRRPEDPIACFDCGTFIRDRRLLGGLLRACAGRLVADRAVSARVH